MARFNVIPATGITELAKDTLFEWVDLSLTFVDRYGRGLGPEKLRKLRARWDPSAVGTLYLSLRDDGRYAILDGHHRVAAARLEGVTHLPARVYLDLTYEQEARLYGLFATVNQQNAVDKFRARLEEREPVALEILGALHGQGLRFVGENGVTVGGLRIVNAVAALQNVYDANGLELLQETLRLLDMSFGSHRLAFSAGLIDGLAWFLRRYGDERLNEQRLVTVLAKAGPEEMAQKARALKRLGVSTLHSPGAMGQTIRNLYNMGMKEENRLPEGLDRVFIPGKSRSSRRSSPTDAYVAADAAND